MLLATEAEETGAVAAGVSVAVSSRANIKQAPMSVAEAEAIFMTRFNLSPSDGEPAAAGAVASFVLDSFQCPLTMEVIRDPFVVY